MGMYTELVIACELKEDTPKEVIMILEYMCIKDGRFLMGTLPDHDLFRTDRWTFMLNCDSAYFSGDTHSTIRKDDPEISNSIYLTVRSNLKNYNNEIEEFLDWINPYVRDTGFLGYKRFEVAGTPTLIYRNRSGEILYQIVEYPEGYSI